MNAKKENERVKNNKISMIGGFIVAAIAYIVLGIFMVTHPNDVVHGTITVFGIGMLLYGIINIIIFFMNKDEEANLFMEMAIGVVAVGIGIFALVKSDFLENILLTVIGAVLIIDGVVNVKRAFTLKSLDFSHWYVLLGFAAVGIILGILCIVLYQSIAMGIVVFVGICLIYEGIASLLSMLMISRMKRKIHKEIMRIAKNERR